MKNVINRVYILESNETIGSFETALSQMYKPIKHKGQTYTFETQDNVILDMQMLSVKFHHLKIGYELTKKVITDSHNHHHVSIERHHYMLKDGIVIGETSHTIHKDDFHQGEHVLEQPEHVAPLEDVNQTDDMHRLKEDYLMDVQAFMHDISRTFYNLWF